MVQENDRPQGKIKEGNPRPVSRSIRTRLLALVLGAILVTVLVISGVAIRAGDSVIRTAQQTSSESLRAQVENYLVQINSSIAERNDLVLDRAVRDVQTVAQAAAAIYNEELPSGFFSADEHMQVGPDGQHLNFPEDVSSIFVPFTTELNADVLKDIEQSAYLDLTIAAVFDNNPNAAAIYLGTVNDVTRYYPNIMLGEVVPGDFQVTKRPWYTSALEGNTLSRQVKAVWSPVYLDATGLGQVTTIAIPVYKQSGELIGVVGLDITLEEIGASIASTELFESGYSFLVDQDGKAIILPEQGYIDFFNRPPEEGEVTPDLGSTEAADQSPKLAPVITRMVAGESGFESIQMADRELFVAYSPLESTGWSLGSIVESNEVLKDIAALQSELGQTLRSTVLTRMLPVMAALLILVIVLVLFWMNRLTHPIQQLADAANKIGAGEWDTTITEMGEDEIGSLARNLASMRDQLKSAFLELEGRVAERTSELEHRTIQLQASTDVVRAVASIRDLDDLLTQITDLISQSFGYYHVGVFLTDEKKQNVVLRAANSPGGKIMLARGHRLGIGQQGIVGAAAGTREPHIALDVQTDRSFYKNPDLPETRSEMALPLIVGEELVGVLDVQSREQAAFIEEDIAVLQTLADQIAIAIENAQLFSENQRALEALQRTLMETSEETWQILLRKQPELGYLCLTGSEPIAVTGEWSSEMERVRESGQALQSGDSTYTIPVKIREKVAGAVKLRKPEGSSRWNQEEIELITTLCDRLSAAIESAHLYEEARRRAARERMTGEITAKIRASDDPQTILETAKHELRRVLQIEPPP